MEIPKKMKAAVLHKPYRIEVEKVPVPELKNDEVLIQVKSCGICGSDVLAYQGTQPRFTYPRIPGHEFSGVIVKIGKGVGKELYTGMRVSSTIETPCKICWACRRGEINICVTLKTIGFSVDGGFGQYMKTSACNIVELPDNISFEEGAVAESLAVGYNASVLTANVKVGDVVVVLGAGTIGICTMAVAKNAGAFTIITDVEEYRLNIARKMGADIVVNSDKENVGIIIDRVTNGMGADIVIETVGGAVSGTVSQAIEIVRAKGSVLVMGTNAENKSVFPVTTFKEKELTMLSARGIPSNTLEEALKLVGSGKVNIKELITRHYRLDDIAEAIRVADEEKTSVMKIVVNHDEE